MYCTDGYQTAETRVGLVLELGGNAQIKMAQKEGWSRTLGSVRPIWDESVLSRAESTSSSKIGQAKLLQPALLSFDLLAGSTQALLH